jgi:hypothetical protein
MRCFFICLRNRLPELKKDYQGGKELHEISFEIFFDEVNLGELVLVDFGDFVLLGRRGVFDEPFLRELECGLLLSLEFFEFFLLFLDDRNGYFLFDEGFEGGFHVKNGIIFKFLKLVS